MVSTEAGTQDGWERWMELMTLVSPFVLLVVSSALTMVLKPLSSRDTAFMLVTAAVTAVWIYVDRLLIRWSRSPVGKVVVFVGLLVLSALLVLRSQWFTLFILVVYGYAFESFPVPWAIFASWCAAVVHARAFVDRWPTTFGALGEFVLLVAVIGSLASAFTLLGAASARLARGRKVVIAELLEANRKLAASMSENARLHAELVHQAEEAAVIAERQRMAREIHDTLAQGLTGIITQLEAAEQADWSRHVATATWLARQSLTEARRSVHAVRPEALEAARLPEALRNTARQWSEVNEMAAEVHVTGTAAKLPADVEVALLRAAQEGLVNVAKHAGAARVGLTLSYMPDVVTLDVRDDGVGFDPDASAAPDPGKGGYGLTGMRQRLESVGGSLVVETEPGAGTALSATVPVCPADREDFGA
ncbi:hypothetical protein GCM10009765_01890 [Fodinicola feengrottensis]|uniref:Oxygen sensor histidine kinase NreB n=1 Tax=Fodinicola feengrottensis TaxID=435914 RepID=A0ABN2FR92_9ACTN